MLSGLFPSWLSLSSHFFVTVTSVSSGVCVFSIINFSSSETSYPSGTSVSLTSYTISSPFEYTAKPAHVYFQVLSPVLCSSAVNVTSSPTASPSAYNCNFISSGLIPSWSSLSSHCLVTVISLFGITIIFSKSSSSCIPS